MVIDSYARSKSTDAGQKAEELLDQCENEIPIITQAMRVGDAPTGPTANLDNIRMVEGGQHGRFLDQILDTDYELFGT